ncbi:MAG: ABC transporter permease [Chloroflexota bacterium]|jgi:ABC-type dipeptide/oligopeptide/nickel transport system permease component|nr:ABC transporter permease [Dehalococcoidia bacterium]MDW8045887.1 ABC transporter permease [Chloroflexota bacterium]
MPPGLSAYLIRRLLWTIPVLLAISFIVFTILRLAPGDPVDTLLGQRYTEETAARLRAKYGYDQPLLVQYGKYLWNLMQGDLGVSTRHADFTVSEVIWPKIKVSSQLGAMALVLTFAIGIPVGVYAALARGTPLDPLTIGFWLAIDAVPVFVAIPILQWLLAVKLGWVRLAWDGVWSPNIILPVLIMSLPGVAGVARFTRASVISVMSEDYVRTARAKGLPERLVVWRHIARNAMLPLITVIGLSLPGIAGGALFVELYFGIPGIAREALDAVLAPDFDVVLALVLFGSLLFVLANIVVDVSYAIIDPRVRVQAQRG